MNQSKHIAVAAILGMVVTLEGMQSGPELKKYRFKKPKAVVMLDVSFEDSDDSTVFFVDRKITIPLKKKHILRTVPLGTITVTHEGKSIVVPNMSGNYQKAYDELLSVNARLPAIIKDGNIVCRYAPVAQ